METITVKMLEQAVRVINNEVSPIPGSKYALYNGYGKYGLEQQFEGRGGVRVIFTLSSKRELYGKLNAFLAGIEEYKRANVY